MQANCNKIVDQKELEQLFGEFIPLKKNTRAVTYNNFMQKNLIFYKIVAKSVKSGKARHNKWFVVQVQG